MQPKKETDEVEELLRRGRREKLYRMVHNTVERVIVKGPEALVGPAGGRTTAAAAAVGTRAAGGGGPRAAAASRTGDAVQVADVKVHVCVRQNGAFGHGGGDSRGSMRSSMRSTFCSWNDD